MSTGKEFQRTDAATGNERRLTLDWRKGRSRRRPGRPETWTSWLKYGGGRPCRTWNAMTDTLKSTRSGRRNQCRKGVEWCGRNDANDTPVEPRR